VIAFLTKGRPEDRVFRDITWEMAVQRLRTLPAPVGEVQTMFGAERQTWTTHSLKRGALTVLWEAAASHLIEVKTVVLLAKHKALTNLEVPSHTVGYASKTYAVARALRTHEATAYIPVEFPGRFVLRLKTTSTTTSTGGL
jgi:hypothetical protein